jgi:hypothetical protein
VVYMQSKTVIPSPSCQTMTILLLGYATTAIHITCCIILKAWQLTSLYLDDSMHELQSQ